MPAQTELPPEAIAFATRMYDAARNGQMDIFQQALPAGLPANMTNDKGDSLVCLLEFSHSINLILRKSFAFPVCFNSFLRIHKLLNVSKWSIRFLHPNSSC